MKNLATVICILFLCQNSFAQQKPWSPFPFGQVSYYKKTYSGSTIETYYTISADSVKLKANGDTIIFLNRKLFENESLCTQPGSTLWDSVGYYNSDAWEFLRDSFKVSGDTVWFHKDAQQLDIPWIFNRPLYMPLNLQLASGDVNYRYVDQWYDADLMDSVRSAGLFYPSDSTLALATGAILVSKNHGIVKFNNNGKLSPTFSEWSSFALGGYRQGNTLWGFSPPTAPRYFQYYVSDIIKWHAASGFFMPWHLYRDSVTAVNYSSDTITVQTHRKSEYHTQDTIIASEGNIQYQFVMNDYERMFSRSTGLVAFGTENWTSLTPIATSTRLSVNGNGCAQDTIFSYRFYGIYSVPDTCEVTFNELDQERNYTFSTARGYMGNDYMFQIGYYSPTKGIACGNFWPLGISTPMERENVQLYPNPTIDKLTISIHQPVSGMLQIIDATGRQLQTHQLNANALVVTNVEALPSGIYFIRVQSKESVYTGKFIKQ